MPRGFFARVVLAVACAAVCNSSPVAQRGRVGSRVGASSANTGGARANASAPVLLARLESREITESSGIVASRRNPGLFWTHNDSGDGPFIYAFDRAGRARGVWRVEGASADDWEDIASGPGPVRGQTYIYAGDIGDNYARREQVVLYRFPEPKIEEADAAATRASARATEPAEAIRLKYPDGPHDAEALLVHPVSGDIYVVTKAVGGAGVYKLSAASAVAGVNMLALVATLRGPDFFGTFVTGGDISPDGRRVALCDYAQGYELRLPNSAAQGFDEVWRQTPAVVPLGARRQGESVCYRLDGAALLATSEGEHPPLYEVTLARAR
ncbi:MAG: hypothetical protein DMF66_04625 [Acidobacteria bacterium]|nr:MAG: hypothetical protein DMF66_04625 [Acidobacteriota bacterium]